jgi:hypothetical protein
MMTRWQTTGPVTTSMTDTRLQLHWAAQAAAGVGRTLIPPRPDDSHTSFTWSPSLGALLQESVNGAQAGIRIAEFSAIVVQDGDVTRSIALHGATLTDAFTFFEEAFGAPLKRPDVDLPDHPVANGAQFDAAPNDLSELARHYANAALVCDGAFDESTVTRCWPHHFDIATLLTLSGMGEHSKSIGVGLSPGDGSYEQPYYYVNAWPYPDASTLPPLRSGHWHTAGWTGAVITASELADIGDQDTLVNDFVAEAVRAFRRALA